MSKPATNLKRLLERLDISNAHLAKNIIVDASLVSRWLNGRRQLKLSSEFIDRLSDYLLNKLIAADGLDWLKHQTEFDGLCLDYASSEGLKNGLKLWLATDVENMSRTLSLPSENAVRGFSNAVENHVQTGYAEIVMFIEATLSQTPEGSKVGIHLSNEDTGVLLQEYVCRALLDSMRTKNPNPCHVR